MKRLSKALVAVMVSIPMLANAGFFTGNHLYQRINSSESWDRATAMGFVIGVHDSFDGEVICSGANVTSGQVRDVVKKYLEDNPSLRDLSAAALTIIALSQAFPCPDKKGKRNS